MQTVQKTKINETLKKGDEYMQKHMPKEALNEYLKTRLSENLEQNAGTIEVVKHIRH